MAEEITKNDHEEKTILPAKMAESPNSEPDGAPANSRAEIPNPNDFTTKETDYADSTGNGGRKGKSCKGCLYYSLKMKSNSRSPLCIGLSRSIPNDDGKSEMKASKEAKPLRDFRYGCIGYSLYSDQQNLTSDPELPVCNGLEVLVDLQIR